MLRIRTPSDQGLTLETSALESILRWLNQITNSFEITKLTCTPLQRSIQKLSRWNLDPNVPTPNIVKQPRINLSHIPPLCTPVMQADLYQTPRESSAARLKSFLPSENDDQAITLSPLASAPLASAPLLPGLLGRLGFSAE